MNRINHLKEELITKISGGFLQPAMLRVRGFLGGNPADFVMHV
jgi:hypothetical protein